MDRDKLFVQHIHDAIHAVERHTAGVSREKFFSSQLIQDAVVRQVLIIGEAANHLSHMFFEKYSHVPWHAVVGMRNQLVHGYFQVDLDEVWKTIQKDIPMLKKSLENIL